MSFMDSPLSINYVHILNCQKLFLIKRIFFSSSSSLIINNSKCQVSLSNPNCMDWMCETEECLIDIKVYDNLIQSQTTLDWIPSNYSQFWGRTLQEGLNGKLGTESTLVNRFFFYKNLLRIIFILYIKICIYRCTLCIVISVIKENILNSMYSSLAIT